MCTKGGQPPGTITAPASVHAQCSQLTTAGHELTTSGCKRSQPLGVRMCTRIMWYVIMCTQEGGWCCAPTWGSPHTRLQLLHVSKRNEVSSQTLAAAGHENMCTHRRISGWEVESCGRANMWRMSDSQDRILALAFRQMSSKTIELSPLHPAAGNLGIITVDIVALQ